MDYEKDIPPLDNDKMRLLLEFVHAMVGHEMEDRRAWITNGIAVTAAVVSSLAAIYVPGGGS